MSKPKRNPDIFKNIIGYEYAKQEFLTILFALDNREEFLSRGITIPRGLMLYGPRSQDNEYLAERFIRASCYRHHFYDGDDNALVEFCNSTQSDHNYIVYITDFDKRAANEFSKFSQIVASIMEDTDKTNIFFIAVVNSLDDVPNKWLLPTRFRRKIKVYLPSYSESVEMVHALCEKKKLPQALITEDLYGLLSRTAYNRMEALIDDAIFHCNDSIDGPFAITIKDIIDAKERYSLRANIFREHDSEKNYKRSAYHEAGHVLVAELLQPKIVGCAIITKARYCYYSGITEMQNVHSNIHNDIICNLAGMVAEETVFGDNHGGAECDITPAFEEISNIILKSGRKGLSDILFKNNFSEQSISLTESQEKAIYNLAEEYKQKAQELISENRQLLDALATRLAEKGYLVRSDIEEIMYS